MASQLNSRTLYLLCRRYNKHPKDRPSKLVSARYRVSLINQPQQALIANPAAVPPVAPLEYPTPSNSCLVAAALSNIFFAFMKEDRCRSSYCSVCCSAARVASTIGAQCLAGNARAWISFWYPSLYEEHSFPPRFEQPTQYHSCWNLFSPGRVFLGR